jgi:hypothetical protein
MASPRRPAGAPTRSKNLRPHDGRTGAGAGITQEPSVYRQHAPGARSATAALAWASGWHSSRTDLEGGPALGRTPALDLVSWLGRTSGACEAGSRSQVRVSQRGHCYSLPVNRLTGQLSDHSCNDRYPTASAILCGLISWCLSRSAIGRATRGTLSCARADNPRSFTAAFNNAMPPLGFADIGRRAALSGRIPRRCRDTWPGGPVLLRFLEMSLVDARPAEKDTDDQDSFPRCESEGHRSTPARGGGAGNQGKDLTSRPS